MPRFVLFVIVSLILLAGGGLVFLMTWDIPAPSRQVEDTLDDSRFPR